MSEPDDTEDNDTEETPEEPTPAAEAEAAAESPAPAPPAAAPMAAPAAAPVPEAAQAPVVAQQQQMPQVAPQPAPLPPPPDPYSAAALDQHDAEFARELLKKEIQPKTYADLWGKKDTLGKIGTFFGLLLSGAGSGLAHQPNALLDMMNKEIDRDLEAQKQNKSNAQNFLQLTYQHELQRAQRERLQYENALTGAQTGLTSAQAGLAKAQTGAVGAEIEAKQAQTGLTKAQTAAVPAEARLRTSQANALDAENAGLAALNRTKNHLLQLSYQDLIDTSKNNPSAQGVLTSQVGPAIQTQIKQNNAKTEAQVKLNTARAVQQQQQQQLGGPEEAVDLNKMQRLINLGRVAPDMPNAIPHGDVPAVTKEANEVKTNRSLAKQYDDSFKKLDSMVAGGRINRGLRDAEVEALATRIAKESGVMSVEQAKKQVNGMFPSWDDWGGSRREKYAKAMEHFKGKEADTTTLERYGLKTPFPNYSFEDKKKKAPAAGGGNGNSLPIERQTADGKVGLFDPQTKKFMGYKGEASSVAQQPDYFPQRSGGIR